MISPASLILLELDLLFRDTDASNSDLIEKGEVDFLDFLFSQMKCKPVERMLAVGRRKVSSGFCSRRRDFSSVHAGS